MVKHGLDCEFMLQVVTCGQQTTGDCGQGSPIPRVPFNGASLLTIAIRTRN